MNWRIILFLFKPWLLSNNSNHQFTTVRVLANYR